MNNTNKSLRRINNEMLELQRNPIPGISAAPYPPGNDPYQWVGNITGPPDTPYAGGLFIMKIQFPRDYPFHAPHIVFQTRVYHPNISDKGCICLDTLKQNWSSALTIGQVLLTIQQLLADPNPRDPLAYGVAQEYLNNRPVFDQKAREYTREYARPPPPAAQNSGSGGGIGGTGSQ